MDGENGKRGEGENGQGGADDEEVFVANMTRMARDLYSSEMRKPLDQDMASLSVYNNSEFARRSLSYQAKSSSGLKGAAVRFRSFSIARGKNGGGGGSGGGDMTTRTSSQPLLSFNAWSTPSRRNNGDKKSDVSTNINGNRRAGVTRRDEAMSKLNEICVSNEDDEAGNSPLVAVASRGKSRPMIRSVSSSSPPASSKEEKEEKKSSSFQQAAAALVISQFGSLRLQKDPQRLMFNETEL